MATNADWTARFGAYAIVTGASDGIGRATALALAARGQNLVIVARRQAALEALAAEARAAHGVDVRVLAVDLAAPEALWTLAAATESLDVGLVVAAAGYGSAGRFLDADPATDADMLAVNCRVVLEICHRFGRRLAARGTGGLVLYSSIVAFQGVPYSATYAATKAFVQTLAEGLGPDFARSGVSVLAVAPGPVRTGFASRARMAMGATDDARTVARETLAALGRRRLVRPGPLSRLLGWGLGVLPRPLRSTIMGQIMKGMIAGPDGQPRQETA